MAITNNNVQNIKFLRNGTLYETRTAALTGINANAEGIADGSAILARYKGANYATDKDDVKTLVGFKFQDAAGASLTVFDTEGSSADVEALRQQMLNTFGTGVTTANTATAQFAALSGTSADGSGVTSVYGAKAYAKDYTDGQIAALDAEVTSTDGTNVQVKVTEVNGKITAVNVATDNTVNSTDVSNAITTAIEDLDVAAITAPAGAFIKSVSQADGKVSATTEYMPTVAEISAAGKVITAISQTNGTIAASTGTVEAQYVSQSSNKAAISATSTVQAALDALADNAAAITIKNDDKSINVTTGAAGTDINVNIKSGEKVLAKAGDAGLYTDIDLVKITTGLPAEIKERYQLLATDDSQLGVNIDIPKDSHIVSINYITTGEHAQNLEYVYIDASGNTQTTYVDMSELVLEAEFASGVSVTDHVVHGVVDPTSENFLTVGADGFKVSGVQNAITTAIGALDVTGDTAVAGQYVAAIEQTDGVVAVKTRANVSDAVLTGYAKGSDSGAVASTDSVKGAISKLENQIDAAEAAAKAAATVLNKDANADHLTLTSTTGSNGETIYTIGQSDIASATALTAEIAARKAVDGQTGQTYAANSSSHYISGASDLNDADVKLAAALYAEEEARKTIAANYVSGATVNGTGVTVTNNIAAFTISSEAATGTASSPIDVATGANGAVTLTFADFIDAGLY